MTLMPNNLLTEAELTVVIENRHAMHREPELSNAEWKTQARLRDALINHGLGEPEIFHRTGLWIDIHGTQPGTGRSVAVRGDIDALPITENRPDLPWQSQIPGQMHACGHDIHASVALGTALALHRMRDSFSGKVRVFFQPAEEAEPVGGRTVAEANLLNGFDAAVGMHVKTDLPAGMFGARDGAVTKSSDQFALTLTGRMAHGARPNGGIDAISIAAAFVNEVQKVVSREMPVDDGAIVTIGTIHGGDASNIICPEVKLSGTIRTSSPERRALLVARVREIAEGVARMHRGTAEFTSQPGEPPVVNDADLVARFRRLVESLYGPAAYSDWRNPESGGGSDDFGYYAACVPGIYFWIGSAEPGNDSGVHTPTFGASDSLLAPATELTVRYCLDLLSA